MPDDLKYRLLCLSDLIFPRYCVCCGTTLGRGEEHICLGCLKDLPRTHFEQRRDNEMAEAFNLAIQKYLPLNEPYACACALFYYKEESPYRDITRNLKYRGHLRMGAYFSRLLALQIQKADFLSDADLVIPVPLHWMRRWERGYNQAEVIARSISSNLDIPLDTRILLRKRRTTTQTRLDVKAKAENVKNAFAVDEKRVQMLRAHLGREPRHILLVDDLFTTGSTMASCQHALRSVFGPEVKISAVTLACVGK